MKWIIIEGPDNVGKSTFISNELAKYLETKTFTHKMIDHISGPKTDNPKEEMKKIAFDYLQQVTSLSNNSLVINDRSIFGELVYSMYRGYYPDYLKSIAGLIRMNIIEVLFVVIYADKDTYKKFNISNKKETEKYESHDQSRLISCKFIDEIHKLNLGKVVVINSNNYDSLDQRNKYLIKHIDAFLSNTKYTFTRDVGCRNIPFNDTQRIFSDGGFISQTDIRQQKCGMYDDLDCELGLEHSKFSKYGIEYNHPTDGFGSLTNVKYVFVGEAPCQKGCGTYGIPFYGDASGNLFMSALYENNISLFNCYITNAIKCCPDNNDLKSYYGNNALELECVQKLRYELESVLMLNRLDTIYAVGVTSFNILSKIFKHRQDIRIKKMHHPAYYVRMNMIKRYYPYLRDVLQLNSGSL